MKNRGQKVHTIEERIKRNIKIDSNGCWIWQGSKRNGYGRMLIGSRSDDSRKTEGAHRVSYTNYKGAIPKGMFVCHHCDNPPCVNPDHLFLGTRQDNVDDRERKGRNKTGNLGKWEEHPNAKLTWKVVNEIRENKEGLNQYQLATKYAVSRNTIKDVLHHKTWIPDPPKPEEDEG